MNSHEPQASPPHAPPTEPGPVKPSENVPTGRQAYNTVTDTIGGVNIRLRDNVVQAGAILLCAIIGAVLGIFVVDDPKVGILVGALIGLVAGLFLSGIALMIFRAVRHAQGKHD